jgi:hypothetical protein
MGDDGVRIGDAGGDVVFFLLFTYRWETSGREKRLTFMIVLGDCACAW